ncbi:MAG: hypothetical protein LBO74_03255 [Candidatus Symbiothrix sp.]|jgi:hypothetical protein|nr:hypothetical protein [Candidatus Symbiothrix sp.]
MKTKKLYILAICLMAATYVFAERTTMKDQTDGWLQKAPAAAGDRPGGITDPPPTGDPDAPEPIGDGIGLVLGLGLVYGVSLFAGKRKKAAA